MDGMSFVSDIALTFIAFNVGSYFKREVIRSTGQRILIVTLFEALLAGALVFFAMKLLFGLSAEFSLLIAAIATATAPASTMMTVRQYRAKGPFVDALMQVVALDDVVCLFVYCIAAASGQRRRRSGRVGGRFACTVEHCRPCSRHGLRIFAFKAA